MKLFERKDQGTPAAGGWTERIRGVVQGTSFRFEPPVPPADRLEAPVVLTELPRSPFPEQTLRSRLRRFMAGKKLEGHSRDQLLHWRFYDTVDQVLSLVSPVPHQPGSGGQGRPRPDGKPSPGIDHPYQIKPAFELLAELPEAFAAERRYLDELLSRVLISYKAEISKRSMGPLTFFSEAQEYFFSGYRIEKTMLRSPELEARIAACQQIYDSYHHGVNYYIYALLARETFDPNNNIFMHFCNALYFKARVEWDGKLLDRASVKKLPGRTWVLFFALRDRSVLKQFPKDADYAKQFRELLRAFPQEMKPAAVAKHKPAARSTRFDRLPKGGGRRQRDAASQS